MDNELAKLAAWSEANPQLSTFLALCAGALVVALTALAQLTLTPDQAHANPRLAAAIILAQKLAPVLRGVLKPLAGVFLPKIAVEVVNALFPAKDATASNAPPSGGGAGGAP